MDWPAQSPDLNPIEHLWDEVERRLRNSEEKPTSREDLYKKLFAIWDKIDVGTVLYDATAGGRCYQSKGWLYALVILSNTLE